jgi:hypothetical protein
MLKFSFNIAIQEESTMKIIKIALISGILWIGFASNGGPFGFPNIGPDSAHAGKNGNGGGNGGENGRGNSGKSKSDRSNGGMNKIESSKVHEDKDPNLSAELKSLNSLNRNINGLVNSSDPKMDAFRELVENGIESGVEPTDDKLLDAMQAAFGEPPKDWSDEAVSWVGDRVNGLIGSADEINNELPETQDPENP